MNPRQESVSELWPSSATASWRSFFASFGRTWVVVACQQEEKGENNAKPRVWGQLVGRGRPSVCCRRSETRKKWCGVAYAAASCCALTHAINAAAVYVGVEG